MTDLTRLAAVLVFALMAVAAQAHKRWLLPTDFALSDAETVTVDFTASNNIFHVDMPMPLDGLRLLSPAGEPVAPSSPFVGKRRSSFDVSITAEGTHRLLVQGPPVHFVSYRLPGASRPHVERGPLEQLRAGVPEGAQDVGFAESTALIETFVTLGATTAPPALPVDEGLALAFASHPNALYSDERAEFVLTFRGKPLPGGELTLIADGSRYRDSLDEWAFSADGEGRVSIEWPGPGRYLLEATLERPQRGGEFAMRYYNYFLTVEVLAP